MVDTVKIPRPRFTADGELARDFVAATRDVGTNAGRERREQLLALSQSIIHATLRAPLGVPPSRDYP
jgi:hypothetical protein